jgi:uncharacterized protein YpbB
MDKNAIYTLVSEEVSKLISEAKEKAPKIEKELESLRTKMEDSMTCYESLGQQAVGSQRKQKRVQLSTVSDILDVPIHELMLYFLNNVKASNDRKLVEYHLGHVYFFASE